MTIVRLGAIVVSSSPAARQFFFIIIIIIISWVQSDMLLTSGVVGVARVRCSFKSGVHEWRWPTQAQLMRSDILRNVEVLRRECLWSLVPLSPRGR